MTVGRDATAATRLPEEDGDLTALINFRYLADALWTTDEAVRRINGQSRRGTAPRPQKGNGHDSTQRTNA